MESKDHARIHTRRPDSNRRPRGSSRRTALNGTPPAPAEPWGSKRTVPLCEICDWSPPEQGSAFCRHCSPSATGDESVDGLHPRDEG